MMVVLTPPGTQLKYRINRKVNTTLPVMLANRRFVETGTDEAPIGEGVNRWPESNPAVAALQTPSVDHHPPSDRRAHVYFGHRRPGYAGRRLVCSNHPDESGKEG